MERTVMKFGGSILSSKEDLQRIADLVKKRRDKGEEICIVVSALKGVTDTLIEASESALKDRKAIDSLISNLRKKHLGLVMELNGNTAGKNAVKTLKEKLDLLEKALYGINYLGELSERSTALIYTFGERLSAVVVAAYLEENGVKASALDASKAIVTDCCFSQANPIMDKTRKKAGDEVAEKLSERVIVVTGYLGADKKGNITCFGRGGSDFSAGILTSAINAGSLELWKDVDGFMSADPRVEKDAELLHNLSYEEAEELGYFGAKVLHPRTVVPLKEKKIKILIKNILTPEKKGTVVSDKRSKHEKIVKSIASRKNIAMVCLKSAAMIDHPGVLAKVFGTVSREGISVDLVSTSEAGLSFTINESDLEKTKQALESQCPDFESVVFDSNVAMIGVIGEGMRRKPGIAGKVFDALGKNDINVEMISQGSSEINLSFLVKQKDLENAVKIIHKKFRE
jgi:aspartate kinase